MMADQHVDRRRSAMTSRIDSRSAGALAMGFAPCYLVNRGRETAHACDFDGCAERQYRATNSVVL